MDRINGLNTIDIGSGRRGFRGRNAIAGVAGTEVKAAWLNGVQEELMAVIEAAGLTPSDADLAQLLKAISKLGSRMLVVSATGVTNWTVPAGVYSVLAEVWGAGGGSGGTSNGAVAGGASGWYRAGPVDVTPGDVIAITVGAGGTAGNGAPTAGGNGGSSSFGSAITSVGGRGSNGASSGTGGGVTAPLSGGAGGSLVIPGAPGSPGLVIGGTPVGAAGGGSFCSAVSIALSVSTGFGASYPGGGANGAGGSTNAAGAAGANGLVIVTY
ncbi:MAG TPA: hypothetical protein VNX29_04550 [Kaistia sp.]|nr:hypothetical protein [Kaistia sp.]